MATRHIDKTAGTYYSCGICPNDFDNAKDALLCERLCQIENYLKWLTHEAILETLSHPNPPKLGEPTLYDEKAHIIPEEDY